MNLSDDKAFSSHYFSLLFSVTVALFSGFFDESKVKTKTKHNLFKIKI